jgi:hypothetical protein
VSARIREFIRGNVLGLVAIFIALSGTAYAVDGPLAGQNTVGSDDIIDGEVQNPDLGAGSVTSAKIGGGEVATGDIAPDAVTTGKIATGEVTTTDLRASSVTGAKIADGSVSGADIAPDSLAAAQVDEASLDASVLQRRITLGCAAGSAIRDVDAGGIVTCEDVGGGGPPTGPAGGDLSGTYPDPTIAADAINSVAVEDSSLTGTDVAPESLNGSDIAGLTGGDVTNSSLTGADIADNLVTGADVNEGTLGTVPNATEVDGLGARSFEFEAGTDALVTTVLNQGGLALKADCENNRGTSQVKLFADSSLNDSHLLAVDDPIVSSADPTLDSDFDSAEANHQLILQEGGNIIETGTGIVTFRGGPGGGTDTTSDDVVTVQYSYLADSDARCTLFGTAIGGPS